MQQLIRLLYFWYKSYFYVRGKLTFIFYIYFHLNRHLHFQIFHFNFAQISWCTYSVTATYHQTWNWQSTQEQCDQMVRLFFNIWPFAIVKISPIMSQICQSQLSILPNMKWTVKNLPKTGKLLPKWRNIAKSGHTTFRRLRRRIVSSETKWNFPLNLKPKNVRFSATFFLFSKFKKSKLDRIAILVNLIKHFTIVNYDSRVVLTRKLPMLRL